jgi:hypothetical protein
MFRAEPAKNESFVLIPPANPENPSQRAAATGQAEKSGQERDGGVKN